jgi:hypothetical protein
VSVPVEKIGSKSKPTDTEAAFQKRVEENLKRGGLNPQKANTNIAKGLMAAEAAEQPLRPAPVQKPTGRPLLDVQREVNNVGLSDVVTPDEARKLSIEFAKPEYQNKTPLMKRRFIMSQLTYGGK